MVAENLVAKLIFYLCSVSYLRLIYFVVSERLNKDNLLENIFLFNNPTCLMITGYCN